MTHNIKENEMRKNIAGTIALTLFAYMGAVLAGSPAYADDPTPTPETTASAPTEQPEIAPGPTVTLPQPGDEDYAEIPTTEEHVELVNELLPDSAPPIEEIPTQEEATEQFMEDSIAEIERVEAEIAANPLPETPTSTPVKPGLPKAGN